MKAMPAAVTLKNIAQKSGVSITTVSRILNGRESGVPIREETRQRVISTAAELGYRPNLLARGLRGSNSSLLGVIMRDITDPFHIQILRGIDSATSARDYRLFLGHVDYKPDVAVAYGSMFEQSHADGIIVIGDMEGDEAALDILTHRHRYVVGVTDRTSRRRYPGVHADSVYGTRLALDHLWELGHRNIVCVSDPRNNDGQMRTEIYEHYMHEHGVMTKSRVYFIPQDPIASYQIGEEIFAGLGASDRPTAIFAASDTFAIYLMQAAYQAGISVPDQISIVGYDNIDITPYTIPPLTSVNQSGMQMGQNAANLMLDMIEQNRDSSEVDDVIMEPTLIVRQSTSVPPGQ